MNEDFLVRGFELFMAKPPAPTGDALLLPANRQRLILVQSMDPRARLPGANPGSGAEQLSDLGELRHLSVSQFPHP